MAEAPKHDGKSTDPKHTMYPEHADTHALPSKEDEMLPRGDARKMPVPSQGGDPSDRGDTAGQHGDMAPEAAQGLEKQADAE